MSFFKSSAGSPAPPVKPARSLIWDVESCMGTPDGGTQLRCGSEIGGNYSGGEKFNSIGERRYGRSWLRGRAAGGFGGGKSIKAKPPGPPLWFRALAPARPRKANPRSPQPRVPRGPTTHQ